MKRAMRVSLSATWGGGGSRVIPCRKHMESIGILCCISTHLSNYPPTLRMCVRGLAESQKVTRARLSNHSSREPWSMSLKHRRRERQSE